MNIVKTYTMFLQHLSVLSSTATKDSYLFPYYPQTSPTTQLICFFSWFSAFQIDASYLSPHVNLASRLEAATKRYGVGILFSEDVFNLLSLTVQGLCR